MQSLRDGAIADLPTSGGEPFVAQLVLRKTGPGGMVLPRSADEVLMTVTLKPEAVAKLGGPGMIPAALEPDRRRFARGARAAGYGAPWVVEVDVFRGNRPRSWVIGEVARA